MRTHREPTAVRVVTAGADRREVIPGISRAKAMFLAAAGASFVMSVYLFFTGDQERGIFVGLWVPSILSAGGLLIGRENDD